MEDESPCSKKKVVTASLYVMLQGVSSVVFSCDGELMNVFTVEPPRTKPMTIYLI